MSAKSFVRPLWWILVVFAGCAAALTDCAPAGPEGEPASASAAPVQTPIALVSQNSNKCVGLSGSSALQQTCTGAASQQWTFNPVSGGNQIVSVFDPTLCLNVPAGSTVAGKALAVTACSSGGVPGEVWAATAVGSAFNLVATQSGQCMDVYQKSIADGVVIDQYTCNGQKNQLWTFQAAPGPDAASDAAAQDAQALPDGDAAAPEAAPPAPVVSLVSNNSGKCVGVSGAGATQQTCTGANTQEWSVQALGGGYRLVSAADSTMCLNVPNGSSTAGLAVAVTTCSANGVPGEIWSTATSGSYVNIVSTASQQCLDVYQRSIADGAKIDQYTCNGQKNQLWTMQPAPGPDAGADASVDASADASVDASLDGAVLPPPVALVSQNSGKCVGVSGTAATQQTCTGAPSQGWSFQAVAGGSRLVSASDTTQCLNVPNGSSTAGAAVAVTACSPSGVPGEIWTTTAVGGNFTVVSTASQQCLDVSQRSIADGAKIDQYTCNGQKNQVWSFPALVPPNDGGADAAALSDAGPDAGADASVGISDAAADDSGDATVGTGGPPVDAGDAAVALVALVSKNSGKCVGAFGSLATQQTCASASSQQWILNPVAGGYQVLSALDPTKCIQLASGSTTLGADVSVATCSAAGAPGDVWTTNASGAYVTVVNANSGQCLDVYQRSVADGAAIDQYTCNGAANQAWTLQTVAAPDPSAGGQWSPVIRLGSVPAAAAMLPSGKVLTWASWEPDNFGNPGDLRQTYTSMFDPASMTSTSALITQTQHDMFCPGIAMLADGRVLISGGGPDVANTTIYDSLANTWSADALMDQVRWYSVDVTLPDGRVFTLGGNRLSGLSGTGEIWSEGAGWQYVPGALMAPLLTTDATNRSMEHPRLFVAPNGLIFVPGPTPNMQWYDLSDGGTITPAGTRGDDTFSQNDVTVMYDVGKLLKAGGNTNYGGPDAGATPSSSNSYLIDINSGGQAAVTKIAPLSHARAYASGVLLPDGDTLVVGGSDNGQVFSDIGAVLTPELFDVATSTWRDLQPMGVPRTYHSVALLLPDARVFVGGGGLCPQAGCGSDHPDLQIFSPPYLFQGPRPQITSAPASASYGASIPVSTTGAVTGFSWVRMSAITHTVNTDQRWLSAPSVATGGGAYSVTVPANANVAPPGYYMLFALNGSVPSVASLVLIGP